MMDASWRVALSRRAGAAMARGLLVVENGTIGGASRASAGVSRVQRTTPIWRPQFALLNFPFVPESPHNGEAVLMR